IWIRSPAGASSWKARFRNATGWPKTRSRTRLTSGITTSAGQARKSATKRTPARLLSGGRCDAYTRLCRRLGRGAAAASALCLHGPRDPQQFLPIVAMFSDQFARLLGRKVRVLGKVAHVWVVTAGRRQPFVFIRHFILLGGLALLAFAPRTDAFPLKALAQNFGKVDDVLLRLFDLALRQFLALALGIDQLRQSLFILVFKMGWVELGELLVDEHRGDVDEILVKLSGRDVVENILLRNDIGMWPQPGQQHSVAVGM